MMKEGCYYLWKTGRGLYILLGLLIFAIFISPFLIAEGLASQITIECVFALILISGIFITPCSAIMRYSLFLLVILSVIARILNKLDSSNFKVIYTDSILAALTLVVFSVLIIKHFLLDKVILRNRIAGAVAVYLIFGMLWARLYEIIHLTTPGAFAPYEKIDPFSLIYFSFVTLMTLGYGDIVPVSTGARSLAILEGITGQLYMVILISSLVSEFSALAIKQMKTEETQR